MRRAITILAVALVGQLVLIGAVWLGVGQANGPTARRLLALAKDDIKTLRLAEGPDDKGVRLERADDGWRLPASDNYPAKSGKVESLVNELAGIQPGLPVASSAAAHSRFDLAADNAQRRIVINEEQSDSVTLLIGKSAGTSRVYARRADREAVHEIRFASWQAEADPANWFETDRLQIPIQDVARVEFSNFALVKDKKDIGWSLKGADIDGEVSVTKIKEFVAKAAQPTFQGVTSGGAPEREAAAGYTLVTREGSERRYDYYGPEGGGSPLIVRADQDWRYQVSSDLFESVRGVQPDQFVADDEASGDNAGDSASSASSAGQ